MENDSDDDLWKAHPYIIRCVNDTKLAYSALLLRYLNE